VRYKHSWTHSVRARQAGKAVGMAGLLWASWMGGTMQARARFAERAEPAAAPPSLTDFSPVALASPPAAASRPAWDLPNLEHERVDHFVDVFSGRQRKLFTRYLTRMGHYQPMISQKLEERGMPQDLIYLAMIESGFSPRAYSHAHASGLWQFISGTGKRYGLDINRAVDERNDPEKATDAALTYLQELHQRFGSWYLAAAAYNTGENRVARVMRQVTGSERGDEQSYYRIRSRLPRETRDYVPLMVAAARIAKEPHKYGFDGVEIAPPLVYDEVKVGPSTSLAAVADAAGTTVAELKRLNPQLKLNRTRNDEPSVLRVPQGSKAAFAARWAELPKSKQVLAEASKPAPESKKYRVRRGDNLIRIAKRHGVTVNEIRRANGIRGSRIRAGQTLRIPTG
jgi:membrane-bound lytic murein transglycosylase D